MIPTIIINLINNKKRFISMNRKLEKTILTDYKFFVAIDGNNDLYKYNFNIMENFIDPIHKRKMTVQEIGCALSHYYVWQYIYENKIDKCLILEDDTFFYENFDEEFKKIIELNFDYDIFYLNRNSLCEHYNLGNEIEISENIVSPKYSYNTNAYIITYNGVKKLLNCNYLNNLITVDEFIPIMYDEFYLFKEYSKYFSKYEKLKAFSLKYDITNQEP